MENNFFRKSLVIGIIILFVGASILPSIKGNIEEIKSSSLKNNYEESLMENITVPDCVKPGDILIFDLKDYDESLACKTFGPYNEHSALYVGDNMFIDSGQPNGVNISNYSHFYLHAKNLAFLHVKTANSNQTQAAINWAYNRIGAPYQNFLNPPYTLMIANPDLPFPTAKKFFCMELIWASYYNQGIDIFQNKYHPHFPFFMILPGENLTNDDDTEIIYTEVNDSIDFIKPNKALYIANKKIMPIHNKTVVVGNIDIELVTLNENITNVDFYIDKIYQANDSNRLFNWTWDEKKCGNHTVMVVASDDFGNQYYTNLTVNKFF